MSIRHCGLWTHRCSHHNDLLTIDDRGPGLPIGASVSRRKLGRGEEDFLQVPRR